MGKNKKIRDKILFLGGSGQIGSGFIKTLKHKYSIFAPSHKQIDIKDRFLVEKCIKGFNPDQIIYSIGFTSIDNAPLNPKEALELNVLGVFNTTQFAAAKKIPVHFLSTEVVFNGYKKDRPYKETDPTDPLSLNAKLKKMGELVTLDTSSQNSVIRLIICYSSFYKRKLDIARMVVRNLKEAKPFEATTDQEINPIYVTHLIKALSKIIDNKASGIYHVGAKDCTTPFDFCKKIAAKLGLDTKLIKGTTFKQFAKTRPEPRPQHEWLDVSKFLKVFGENSLFTVDEGIEEFAKDYEDLNRENFT